MQTTEESQSEPVKSRMNAYRARLRAAGLRPVQIWVPDVRKPHLAEEARRQSLLAARHAEEQVVAAFIDEAADHGPPA